jgi:hypothetical protein
MQILIFELNLSIMISKKENNLRLSIDLVECLGYLKRQMKGLLCNAVVNPHDRLGLVCCFPSQFVAPPISRKCDVAGGVWMRAPTDGESADSCRRQTVNFMVGEGESCLG